MMRTFFIYICLISVMIMVWGCTKKPASKEKPQPPAMIENPVKETSLTTITLTSDAVKRLGIELAAVETRTIQKNRTYGAEIVPVSGRMITVVAPLSGTILLPQSTSAPAAGMQLTAAEPIFNLLLALPQQDILAVQEDVALKQAEFELADKAVRRVQQLLNDKAGSLKELEQAQTQLSKSAASLNTAKTRLELLQKGEINSVGEGISSLIIRSPIDGVIQKVYVAPGQAVTASEILLEITGIDTVWIKVPVYVGDLPVIDSNQPARVHSLSDFAAIQARSVTPISASFIADSQAATADIFYELPNKEHSYRPGQKVSVTIPLKVSQQSLVVPYSSILFDMYGGAWIYENTQTNKYVRQRVELQYVLDDIAVLSRSPAAGAKVVTAGSAELFGTEFGVAK